LFPFERAIARNIPSIMTAHVVFSALDAALPATLSRAVIGEHLRKKLGYSGLVVSDDLEMKSIADHFGVGDAAVRGVAAGMDMLLVCHSAERAHSVIDALSQATLSGDIALDVVVRALERQRHFASRWAAAAAQSFDPSALRAPKHLALAERLASYWEAAPGRDPTERVDA
jgi:beta-N-acetylhexosaminidase